MFVGKMLPTHTRLPTTSKTIQFHYKPNQNDTSWKPNQVKTTPTSKHILEPLTSRHHPLFFHDMLEVSLKIGNKWFTNNRIDLNKLLSKAISNRALRYLL
jgi:hypothetical protein